jgi:transcriptional regulator GlxA family with amidase domain
MPPLVQEVGMSPAKFIERVRLEAARSMLTQSNQSIEQVAVNSGFASAEQMRRTFQRLLNTTPQDFRTNFK